jgi:GT2 family glycosyltransferase
MTRASSLSCGVVIPTPPAPVTRPQVHGKFFFISDKKFYVRGVTYGTFRQDADRDEFHDRELVGRDFAQMAANGINAVRTYTPPPLWLLDEAQRHGLRVMVGLPWEQHVTFLDSRSRMRSIVDRVRAGVRACSGHPAVFCYAIGNEVPAPIVRWHGRSRVERFLKRLYHAAKEEDPGALVTYVNYPSTEYLLLPFVDFYCFNVYLESRDKLEAYLARLHNLAGDRPVVLAEIGLDSRRSGEDGQAVALDWQVRTAFERGCAGTFVFSWTDEWHRGGFDVEDWDFGLTRRDRQPKPSLATVRQAYSEVPFPADRRWPRISVVVCTYNGERTIRDCLDGLRELDYPDYEVIVVNDGSTDATAEIAREYGFKVISTGNRGLSNARNTGMEAASGEIIAYTDDDARPDPQWLKYLADTLMHKDYAMIGGPNIAPRGDGPLAECVANAPGGPIHVLLSDEEAEHVPGCNMAVRKFALKEVGGFDPQYRVAGDDVDVCWRLRESGWRLGFNHAAMVWHHRRNSLRAYWKQQKGYGKAEALLEKKWPEKYNAAGHVSWAGRLYGKGLAQRILGGRGKVYQGSWGRALFQSVYEPAPRIISSLPLMPEWYLLVGFIAFLSAMSALWGLMLLLVPVLIFTVALTVAQAVHGGLAARFLTAPRTTSEEFRLRAITACLHLIQPLARLRGRLTHDLTLWRRRGDFGVSLPRPLIQNIWSERWRTAEEWLGDLERHLRSVGRVVLKGGDFDRWDLEVRGGMMGRARTLMTVEEHGAGRQLVRFRSYSTPAAAGIVFILSLSALSALAALDGAASTSVILAALSLLLLMRVVYECASAANSIKLSIGSMESRTAEAYARAPERSEVLRESASDSERAAGELAGATD